MKIIAHRANINGPSIKNENQKNSIKECLNMGYDVELDIRSLEGKLYLGHDKPQLIINIEELRMINNKVWVHCKNLQALSFFRRIDEEFNYFWHEKDSYTLTSKGYIWAYPGRELSPECISVMPEINCSKDNIKDLKNLSISGICTDYPNLFN